MSARGVLDAKYYIIGRLMLGENKFSKGGSSSSFYRYHARKSLE